MSPIIEPKPFPEKKDTSFAYTRRLLQNLGIKAIDGAVTNVTIGGNEIQYVIGNTGIFSFGDGSDGAATFSNQGTAPTGTTKTDNTDGATIFRLDRDVYYTTMTVDATVTIDTNGYRIFCIKTLTVNGTIDRSGNTGSAGSAGASGVGGGGGGTGGSGGAALADGYLKGSPAGGDGGDGGDSNSDNDTAGSGNNVSNSLGSNGSVGGTGGTGGTAEGQSAYSGSSGGQGTATSSNVKLIANWHLATLLDIGSAGTPVKFTGSASGGGGGGGGAGHNTSGSNGGGAGGGGAGSNGGIIAIYAKSITIGTAGIIQTNGGDGGKGGTGGDGAVAANTGGGGAGGAGAGGNGGEVILVYNEYTNNGTVQALGGSGGAAATGGSGGGTGTDGADTGAGNSGSDGTIRQFQVSL